jgi:hypothetical protein
MNLELEDGELWRSDYYIPFNSLIRVGINFFIYGGIFLNCTVFSDKGISKLTTSRRPKLRLTLSCTGVNMKGSLVQLTAFG